MQTRLWYIKHTNIFSWLGEEVSDDIYLIKAGRVKLTRSSEAGRQMILDILGPSEIFGELSLIGEAMDDSSFIG